jgi:hypothetical protein
MVNVLGARLDSHSVKDRVTRLSADIVDIEDERFGHAVLHDHAVARVADERLATRRTRNKADRADDRQHCACESSPTHATHIEIVSPFS